MAESVLTNTDTNFQAFRQATTYAQQRAQAAENARAAIAALIPDAQVAANAKADALLAAGAKADALAAASAKVNALAAAALLPDLRAARLVAAAAAGLIPHSGGDHTTIPAGAGVYRLLTSAEVGQIWERVAGGGVLRRPELEAAAATDVQTAQALAEDAKAVADAVQGRVQGSTDTLGSVTLTSGRVQTELGAFDVVPAAGQTPNGGTVRSIGVPGYVAKLGTSGPLDFRLFRPDLSGNGATQNTAKLQAALDEVARNHEVATLDVPPGVLFLYGPAELSQNRQVSIRAAGIGTTLMVQTSDSHLFDVDLQGAGTFTLSGASLLANTVMTTGAAVNIIGGPRLPGLIMRDVEIAANDGQWATGVRAHNVGEPYFDNVIAYGRSIAAQIADNRWFDAWHLTADAPAMDCKWVGCKVYKARYGIHAENSGLPGLEGLQLVANDLVDVMQGVRFTNAAGYRPPQLSILGGHMNYREFGVFGQNISQVQIGQVLMYARGREAAAGEGANLDLAGRKAVYLADATDVQIHHLQLFSIFGGDHDYDGVVLGNVQRGSISHVKAEFRSATQGQVLYLAPNTSEIEYSHLSRVSGARTVQDDSTSNRPGGYLYPRDAEDVQAVIAAASVLDLAPHRRTAYIVVGGPSGETITEITGREPGDTVTLQFDVAVTIPHTATMLLAGQTAANLSGGQTITLYRQPGGWREIGRQ